MVAGRAPACGSPPPDRRWPSPPCSCPPRPRRPPGPGQLARPAGLGRRLRVDGTAARPADHPRRSLAGRRRAPAPAVHVRPGVREPDPRARLHGQPGRGHRPGHGVHPAGPARPGRLERRVRDHPAAARPPGCCGGRPCGRRWPAASPGRWPCGGSAKAWAACSPALASPLTGAPGAVILYALLAVLAWPRARTLQARAAQASPTQARSAQAGTEEADRRDAGPVAAGSPLGLTGARVAWLVLWGSFAYFILQAANRAPGAVRDTFASLAAGEPGWIAAMDRGLASAAGGHGLAISIGLAVVFVAAGLGVFWSRHHAGRAAAERDRGPGHLGARGELRRDRDRAGHRPQHRPAAGGAGRGVLAADPPPGRGRFRWS